MRLRSTGAPWKTNRHFGEQDARWKRFADRKRPRVARHYQREATRPVVARFSAPAIGALRFFRRLAATLKLVWRAQRWR